MARQVTKYKHRIVKRPKLAGPGTRRFRTWLLNDQRKDRVANISYLTVQGELVTVDNERIAVLTTY